MKLTLTKTILLTLAAGSLMACGSLRAQDSTSTNTPAANPATNAPPHMMFRAPSIEGLARALNLTAAQKTEVQPILESERQQQLDVRMDNTLTYDEIRTKMQAIREKTASQLKLILTPEQFQKWQNSQWRPHRTMSPPPGSMNGAAGSAP